MAIFPVELAPIFDILIFTVLVTLVLNLLQKFLVNQEEAGNIREKMKQMNNEMKELQKEGKRDDANNLLNEYLKENSKIMKMSLKPLLFSLVIILIVFTFANNAYETIIDVSKTPEFEELALTKEGNEVTVGQIECTLPCTIEIENNRWHVYEQTSFLYTNPNGLVFSQIIADLPIHLPLAGANVGWLGWYIISAIPIALILRSLLKINV